MQRVLVFLSAIVVCSLQFSDGLVSAEICVDHEDRIVEDHAQCESCSCENMSSDDNCTSEFCPCLKMLCNQSIKLKNLKRKLQIENESNSEKKIKKHTRKHVYNVDKRDNIDINNPGEDIVPDFKIQMDNKRHKRNTEHDREQNNPILERYFGMNQLIRLMSIDYPMPVTQPNTDLSGVLVVLLYSTVVLIGITICVLVYKKYGHNKKERRRTMNTHRSIHRHLMNNDHSVNNHQQFSNATSLLDEPPPSYEECTV